MLTAEAVVSAAQSAPGRYHRLVVVVAPKGGGKTVVLKQAQGPLNAAWVNLGLELSHRLLEMTERQRTLRVQRVLDEILSPYSPDQIVILDNIEILFDRSLALNPLNLLQSLSRNRTLLATWSGNIEDGWLTYASPGHPEYQRYPIQDLLYVD
jgi:hypothetical protein